MSKVESFIQQRLSHNTYEKAVAKRIINNYHRFIESKLDDTIFANEIASGDNAKWHQRLWEVELACHLMDKGFILESEDYGPDLRTEIENQRIWIEAVSPKPIDIPDDYLKSQGKDGEPYIITYPANEVLLRVCWGIFQKYKKYKKYREKGLIRPEDGYIIAVDTSQLGAITVGISGLPLAVEALIPAGPFKIEIDRSTGKQVSSGLSHRDKITNEKADMKIPTDIFAVNRAPEISAVISARSDLEGMRHSVFVHNPDASAPVPTTIWGVETEYQATLNKNEISIEAISNN